ARLPASVSGARQRRACSGSRRRPPRPRAGRPLRGSVFQTLPELADGLEARKGWVSAKVLLAAVAVEGPERTGDEPQQRVEIEGRSSLEHTLDEYRRPRLEPPVVRRVAPSRALEREEFQMSQGSALEIALLAAETRWADESSDEAPGHVTMELLPDVVERGALGEERDLLERARHVQAGGRSHGS